MAEVILLRHGQTAWSLSGQHTGVTDIPLTSVGEQQARTLGRWLEGRTFGQMLSSPRQHARRSLEIAGRRDYAGDDNLAEWDYGAYERLTSAEIDACIGRRWSLWQDGVPPGCTPGETGAQVAARATAVLDRVRPTLADGRDVLMVAHGHVLRVLAAAWMGLPPSGGGLLALSAGSMSVLGYEHDCPVLTGWNTVAVTMSCTRTI